MTLLTGILVYIIIILVYIIILVILYIYTGILVIVYPRANASRYGYSGRPRTPRYHSAVMLYRFQGGL